MQLLAHGGSKAAPRPRCVHQPITLPIPEDQRVEVPATGRTPADYEILRSIDAHLPPRARPLARFIGAIEALGDDTFQPLLADGSDQIRQTGVELRREVANELRAGFSLAGDFSAHLLALLEKPVGGHCR